MHFSDYLGHLGNRLSREGQSFLDSRVVLMVNSSDSVSVWGCNSTMKKEYVENHPLTAASSNNLELKY